MSKKNDKFNQIVDNMAKNSWFVVITGICSGVSFLSGFLSDSSIIKNICISISGILVILLIVKALQYRVLQEKANENCDKKISDLFNETIKFNQDYKIGFDNIQDVGTYNNLSALLKPLSDYLSYVAKTIIDVDSNICIKIIETESLMNNNIEDWKVKTIARNSSTDARRRHNDERSISIRGNSDFWEIVSQAEIDEFIAPDLQKLKRQREENGKAYLNTTKNYLKRYHSTIVVPIKTGIDNIPDVIKSKINSNDTENNPYYHIVGFLCWDSKSVFDDDNEKFLSLVAVLESYADMIYLLLQNYLIAVISGTEK